MKITHGLLLGVAAGAAIGYYGGDWQPAGYTLALVSLVLLARWLRRQPHPRLDRIRQVFAPRASSAKTVIRTGDQSRRQHGLASARQIHKHGSAATVKKLAPVVRPSLAGQKITPAQVGVKLCRVGQQDVWASVEDFVLAVAAPRSFKALALDTPIPTPAGWTTMGELQDGDELYDEVGQPCRVTAAHPIRYERPCYEVVVSDGSVIVADAEHLWQVETRTSRRHGTPAKVLTTAEMVNSVRVGGDARANYSIPVAEPLAAAPADLPIAPYTLGAWLGDGANRSGVITLGTRKASVAEEIRADGYELTEQLSSRRPGSTAYNITDVKATLRRADLLHNKHIPAVYFRASESQRRALLAGLLDTDGTCGQTGNIVFTSTCRQLADDVRSLIATLGYVSTINEYRARLNGQDAGPVWYVTFCPDQPVFRLVRKAERQSTKNKASNKRRFIVDIRPIESVPVRCITVDSPSSLFLVGDQCIATHNSGWMASSLIDYPGSAVATSLRPDLFTNTEKYRARLGPVYVFNASSIEDLDNVVTFDPLTGCESPEIAIERAEDMVPAATGEQQHWADLARAALASLMHAAALGGHTIDEVQRWVADPDEHQDVVIRLLRSSSSKTVIEDARQFLENNPRTRSSITTSIMPALRWLQFPIARRAAGLEGEPRPFQMGMLLDATATLYVLGQVETSISPLMGALVGHVARGARRQAGRSLSGRLDPPLGLHLDEAANSKPPLPDWTSSMGGSGITIKAAFQGRAQMIDAYGREGAGIILTNAGAIMLGGGAKDPDDLTAWSELAGKRDERTETTDGTGKVTSVSQRQVPVLPPSQIANMPPGEVVVFRRGMLPAIGRVQMVWDRKDLHRLPPVETSTPVTTPAVPVEEVVEATAIVDYLPAPVEEVDTRVER